MSIKVIPNQAIGGYTKVSLKASVNSKSNMKHLYDLSVPPSVIEYSDGLLLDLMAGQQLGLYTPCSFLNSQVHGNIDISIVYPSLRIIKSMESKQFSTHASLHYYQLRSYPTLEIFSSSLFSP